MRRKIHVVFAWIVFCFQASFAQWLQTSGPLGGRVNSFALNGTTIFAGASHGVFVSADAGSNWTNPSSDITGKTVRAFAVSGTTLFAGTSKNGVYMSSNNGAAWTSVSTGLTDMKITSLAVNGTNLFAGTETGGVFFSSNNGSNWSAVNSGLADNNITCIATTGSGTTVFAGTDSSGVFRSVDSGTSWTAVKNGLNDTSVTTLHISGSNIFAGTTTGLYVSTNSGSSWTAAGVNQYITSIARKGDTVFAGGLYGGLYLSTNSGGTWGAANTGLSGKNILSILVTGTVVVAGTNGDGVYTSPIIPVSWSPSNTGLINVDVSTLAVNGTTGMIAGTRHSGLFTSSNSGNYWTSSNTGLPGTAINSIVVNGSGIFAGTDSKVFKSTDAASTWSAVNTGLTAAAVYSIGVSDTNIFAATSYGIFRSTDNGASWVHKLTGLQYPAIMSAIAVTDSNIFVGTGGWGSSGTAAEKGIFRSADKGETWVAVNTGLTNKNIYALATEGTSIYAGTSGGVFLSTNNGGNWTAINDGLPATAVYALIITGSNVTAGTDNGVFSFSGSQWTSISAGLPANTVVNCLVADATDIYAGTNGTGVWKRPLSEITGCVTPGCLVWPGDTDNDLAANHYDLLPVGVYYGQTGMSRDAVDNLWSGHNSVEWGILQANGADVKYVDCNGDGIINSSDTVAIGLNYGETHAKTEDTKEVNAGDPDLYFITTYSVYAPGATIDAELWAGTAANKAKKLYGIGFDLSYDNSLVQPGPSLTYSSDLTGTNTLSMTRLDGTNGKIHGAITRTTHTGVSGYGKIATVKFKASGSIASLTTLTVSLAHYEAIDSAGNPLAFNTVKGTINIEPVGIRTIAGESEIKIYPNPNAGKFSIQTNNAWSNAEIRICDVLGNRILVQQLTGMNNEVDLSAQAQGIYFLNLSDRNGRKIIRKIVVQ